MEKCIKFCNSLIGQKFQSVTRTLDMVEFGFGDLTLKKNRKGKMIEIAKYAVHVQCPCRIVDKSNIILGYDDLYMSSKMEEEGGDLNKQGSTFFDVQCLNMKNIILTDQYVQDVVLKKYGDLIIKLQDIQIQIFVASSSKSIEVWRMFETQTDAKHMVVYGNMIEYE